MLTIELSYNLFFIESNTISTLKLSFAHIINPVRVGPSSDLFIAQPITFESMLKAKSIAGELSIELLATQYDEDLGLVPTGFETLDNLHRSVLDFRAFSRPRKYPLIKDILMKAYEFSVSDYVIYTNVDIGLMPGFYRRINELLSSGHDALIINRRRIPAIYESINDLDDIYKNKGLSHPGFDCFIFKREWIKRMRTDNICVGVPFIGVVLAYNLMVLSNNLKLIDDEHLTFHIGMDVMPKRDKEYYWYNRKQFDLIYKEFLAHQIKWKNIPYNQKNIFLRYWKWAWNPSLFTFKLFLQDIKRLGIK